MKPQNMTMLMILIQMIPLKVTFPQKPQSNFMINEEEELEAKYALELNE